MVRYCIVPNCGSSDMTILGHRFPRKQKQQLAWLESLGISKTNDTIVDKYIVCSLHFDVQDYRNEKSNYLNTTACPKLHVTNPRIQVINAADDCNNSVELIKHINKNKRRHSNSQNDEDDSLIIIENKRRHSSSQDDEDKSLIIIDSESIHKTSSRRRQKNTAALIKSENSEATASESEESIASCSDYILAEVVQETTNNELNCDDDTANHDPNNISLINDDNENSLNEIYDNGNRVKIEDDEEEHRNDNDNKKFYKNLVVTADNTDTELVNDDDDNDENPENFIENRNTTASTISTRTANYKIVINKVLNKNVICSSDNDVKHQRHVMKSHCNVACQTVGSEEKTKEQDDTNDDEYSKLTKSQLIHLLKESKCKVTELEEKVSKIENAHRKLIGNVKMFQSLLTNVDD